jgi:hypothetical protein
MELIGVEVGRIVAGIAGIPLKLAHEVDAKDAGDADLRVLSPSKFDV